MVACASGSFPGHSGSSPRLCPSAEPGCCGCLQGAYWSHFSLALISALFPIFTPVEVLVHQPLAREQVQEINPQGRVVWVLLLRCQPFQQPWDALGTSLREWGPSQTLPCRATGLCFPSASPAAPLASGVWGPLEESEGAAKEKNNAQPRRIITHSHACGTVLSSRCHWAPAAPVLPVPTPPRAGASRGQTAGMTSPPVLSSSRIDIIQSNNRSEA